MSQYIGSSSEHSQASQSGPSQTMFSSSSSFASKSSRAGSSPNSKMIACPFCTRQFASSTTYEQHIQIFHTRSSVPHNPKQTSYPCPDCGKSFTAPSKRDLHQNVIHKGIKPFKCEVCGKAFGYKGGTYIFHVSHLIPKTESD